MYNFLMKYYIEFLFWVVECQYTEWSTDCVNEGNKTVHTRKIKETDDVFFGLECKGNTTKDCDISRKYFFGSKHMFLWSSRSLVYSEMFYMLFFVVEKNANYTTSNTTKYNVDTDNGKQNIEDHQDTHFPGNSN